MIEPDGLNIFVVLNIVYCSKMQFLIKIKVLREAPKQAHLRMKYVSRTRNLIQTMKITSLNHRIYKNSSALGKFEYGHLGS